MTKITNTYEHLPAAGKPPKQLVLLLHGLGSNGQDLISLAPLYGQILPDAAFVSPDAPFPCDMAPVGYQWFSLQSRDPHDMLKGVQTAAPILDAFIAEQLEKYDVSADKCALVGFSQGTMMSLYAGPRYESPMAGVLGYSGALLWEEGISADALHQISMHLVHGEADDVVPVQAYHHARQVLEEYDFNVSGHTTPGLGHSIDQKGLETGAAFLRDILS